MKRSISRLAFLALAAGIIGAFAFTPVNHPSNLRLPQYYWFNTSMAYQDLKSVPDEQSRTGCSGSAALCEKGYDQSQLINPANPAQGVKSGQIPAANIFHQ